MQITCRMLSLIQNGVHDLNVFPDDWGQVAYLMKAGSPTFSSSVSNSS